MKPLAALVLLAVALGGCHLSLWSWSSGSGSHELTVQLKQVETEISESFSLLRNLVEELLALRAADDGAAFSSFPTAGFKRIESLQGHGICSFNSYKAQRTNGSKPPLDLA